MSSRAIKEHANDKSWMRMFACCQKQLLVGGPQQLTQGEGEMFDCNVCQLDCAINVSASLINQDIPAVITPAITEFNNGTINMPSVDIEVGLLLIQLYVNLQALNATTRVSGVTYSGDTVSVAPAVPFDVTNTSPVNFGPYLKADVAGAYSVTIVVQTACGVVTIVQPYNILP